MLLLLACVLSMNPFYESNFSSVPLRSLSIFSNPGGLGIQPGAELLFTYHPDTLVPVLSLGNLGFGMMKIDSIEYYEIAAGYKLPGAFSLGYARQFGETSYHIFGLIARSSPRFSLGYRTTLGERYHMIGGISLRPFEQYLTISGDIEYEGIDSILNYSYGAMIQPQDGIKLSFLGHHVDDKFRWNAGLELSFGKIKVAGAYAHADEKKLRIGIILSAQPYRTFMSNSSNTTQSHLNKGHLEERS